MLKIARSEDNGLVTFTLSGRIDAKDALELQSLLDREPEGIQITLDLEEVRLVDRETVRFLSGCEARGIKLRNCPPYIRQWIETGSGTSHES
jgi:anti-anti-sigma regulatory factor